MKLQGSPLFVACERALEGRRLSSPNSSIVLQALAHLSLAFFLSFGWAGLASAEEPSTPGEPAPLVLILDASGSMWGQVDGENKIVIARRALGQMVDDLPAASEVALVAYGHRRKGDCADIETLIPLGALDRPAVKSAVEALNPKGKTPITASVEQALEIVEKSGEAATVVLLSDGLETCGGDPCRAVKLAKEAGAPLVLHVVGFDVEGEDLSQLQCMAQAGGGLFLSAEDAGQLGTALERAVAQPVDAPVGRLAVHAVADGELQDVSVRVMDLKGEQIAVTRTYRKEETNPSSIPLPDGRYKVRVLAMGMEGDRERHFEVEIVDGGVVEKTVDFSTGLLRIGVQCNGELSDAVFKIYDPETGKEVESGRTYRKAKTNPASIRLTVGEYDVKVKSLDVSNKVWIELGRVTIEPSGEKEVEHSFESGTLKLGALRDEELVDAVVDVIDAASGKAVGKGRTYTSATSNPKTFELLPGTYRVKVKFLGKDKVRQEAEVKILAGAETVHNFKFPG